MNISLPPDQEAFVKQLIESGRYSSEDEVIQISLFLLKDHEEFYKTRLEELRKEIAVGLEQADRGEVAALDMEAIKEKARQRLAQAQGGH
jgi:antitoxin ParD1/3/4